MRPVEARRSRRNPTAVRRETVVGEPMGKQVDLDSSRCLRNLGAFVPFAAPFMKFRHLALALLPLISLRAEIAVIPRPAAVTENAGHFAIAADTGVRFEGAADEALLLGALAEGGVPLAKKDGGTIVFVYRKPPRAHRPKRIRSK